MLFGIFLISSTYICFQMNVNEVEIECLDQSANEQEDQETKRGLEEILAVINQDSKFAQHQFQESHLTFNDKNAVDIPLSLHCPPPNFS